MGRKRTTAQDISSLTVVNVEAVGVDSVDKDNGALELCEVVICLAPQLFRVAEPEQLAACK